MKTLIKPKKMSEIEKNIDNESLRKITAGEACMCHTIDPCTCKVTELE